MGAERRLSGRKLGNSNAVSVAYVAAAGRNLLRQDYWVNPNDNITYAYLLRNDGFSNFQSMQAQFQCPLSRDLTFIPASSAESHDARKFVPNQSADAGSHRKR